MTVTFPFLIAASFFSLAYGICLYVKRSALGKALEKARQGRKVKPRIKKKEVFLKFFARIWLVPEEKLGETLSGVAVSGGAVFVNVLIFSRSFLAAAAIGLPAGLLTPRIISGKSRKKLQQLFRGQLGQLTEALISASRNRSLPSAVRYAASEMALPLGGEGGELEKLLQDYDSLCSDGEGCTGNLGAAAWRFAERVGIMEAYVLAESLAMLEETGAGERAEEVLALAHEFVKERQRLRDRVKKATVVIRGGYSLAMLFPPAMAAWLCTTLVPYRTILLSPRGMLLGGLALLIEAAGLLYINKKVSSTVAKFF